MVNAFRVTAISSFSMGMRSQSSWSGCGSFIGTGNLNRETLPHELDWILVLARGQRLTSRRARLTLSVR